MTPFITLCPHPPAPALNHVSHPTPGKSFPVSFYPEQYVKQCFGFSFTDLLICLGTRGHSCRLGRVCDNPDKKRRRGFYFVAHNRSAYILDSLPLIQRICTLKFPLLRLNSSCQFIFSSSIDCTEGTSNTTWKKVVF